MTFTATRALLACGGVNSWTGFKVTIAATSRRSTQLVQQVAVSQYPVVFRYIDSNPDNPPIRCYFSFPPPFPPDPDGLLVVPATCLVDDCVFAFASVVDFSEPESLALTSRKW